MMVGENVGVSIQNISKAYLLYKQPQDRLKQSLFRYFGKDYARMFWALQDVSYEVQKGEVFGIIGRNGSGKSTLLQIVAGILQPTRGKVVYDGRLTALMELGAGFNPEFTGRENIYFNGAIFGLSEENMRERQDEIIHFADIGDFIDQPIKLYSSGMFIRLAFAIATSVTPDVLLIDEALAVGDAGFVIKCMNRMKQLKDRGTTILLVTHDVQTARSFCDTAMWLNDGHVQAVGSPLDVTSKYIQFLFQNQEIPSNFDSLSLYNQYKDAGKRDILNQIDLLGRIDLVRWGSGEIQIESFSINDGSTAGENIFEYGQNFRITVTAKANKDIPTSELGMGIAFRNNKGLDIITSTTYDQNQCIGPLQTGQRVQVVYQLENILAPGDYALVLNFEDRSTAIPHYYDFIENALILKTVSKFPIFSQVLPDVKQKIIVM